MSAYEPNQSFKLKNGDWLKIVDVYEDSINAVLVSPVGEYIEYEDVSPSTIDAIVKIRR